jgi:hypothetical protein
MSRRARHGIDGKRHGSDGRYVKYGNEERLPVNHPVKSYSPQAFFAFHTSHASFVFHNSGKRKDGSDGRYERYGNDKKQSVSHPVKSHSPQSFFAFHTSHASFVFHNSHISHSLTQWGSL